MSLDPVKNLAKATVSTGYDAAATSIALTSGHGAKFPDPSTDGAFNLVWWNATDYPDPADDPNVEIVRCTARSTDTLTVTRAQEGTSASTKNTGGKTYRMILAFTKKTYDDLKSVVQRVTPTGTINGSNAAFTIPAGATLLMLVHNRMVQIEGAGQDYTFSTPTITYANAPQTGDVHYALIIN